MPINFSNNVPFKLTPQDMGGFDLMSALRSGQQFGQSQQMFPQQLQNAKLANMIKQVQANYAEPNAQAALKTAQQHNQYDPRIWESQIGLQGAQAGKANKETQWYDREANARVKEAEALAGLHGEQARQAALLNDEYRKRLIGNQSAQQQNVSGTDQGQSQAQGVEPSQTQQPQNIPSGQFAAENTTYGIPNPTVTNDDIINQKLFGIDTYSSKKDMFNEQLKDQYTKFNNQIQSGVKGVNSAQKARGAINTFTNAMDTMDKEGGLTGPFWGTSPTSGWRTAFHPFHDYTQEQIAENAQANIIPGAMAEVKEAMGEGKFSVIDMQAAQKMKFDRTMTKDARKNATEFMNGIFNRMDESTKFYQTLNNPRKGVDKSTADLLWQNYQNNFPLTDEKGNYQGKNVGNWPLYTTPKAIASVKATGTYKPTQAEKDCYMMNVPDKSGKYHMLPVKKGKVEQLFRSGATPL